MTSLKLKLKVDTNLEAYKLVYDPTHLFFLLYTKYGDIEEDYNILIINQILYNKFSHINTLFKESRFSKIKECLRRQYNIKESINRIPKLYEYYKNYYNYFCKPFFLNYFSANVLHNYYNNQAEIFYKNNYSHSKSKKNSVNKKQKSKSKSKSNTLSSFDNDTENKTIFNKKNKYIIENNSQTNNSISLTLNNSSIDNKELLTKRNNNDSFEKCLQSFVMECKYSDSKQNTKILTNKENNKMNNCENNNNTNNSNEKENHNKNDYNLFKNICLKNKEENYLKNENINNKKIKDNNNNEINEESSHIIKEINNNNKKLTLKLSRNISKLEDLKNNINILNKKHNFISNESSLDDKNIINIDNNKNIENDNNFIKETNKNTINIYNKNFLKLNDQFNNKNIIDIKSRNSPIKENDLLKIKKSISLKKENIINTSNHIKIIKISNNKNNIINKLIKKEKRAFSLDKNYKKGIVINDNSEHIKINSTKFNTIIKNEKNKKKNKYNIFNKFSSSLFNKKNSDNLNINNNKLLNYDLESFSPKFNFLFRNELGPKPQNKKLKTSSMVFQIDSNKYERLNENKNNIIKAINNNSSYFNNEYEQKHIIRSFKSEQNSQKRKSNLISRNFLFKNYTMRKTLLNNNNKMNNLKNFLCISRNKNATIVKSKSNPLSISQSKSTSYNLVKVFSFKTNIIENKKISISNLKLKKKNHKKVKIEKIIKNSRLLNSSLGKSINNNNNVYKLHIKNGIFSPISKKQSFNCNLGMLINKKK